MMVLIVVSVLAFVAWLDPRMFEQELNRAIYRTCNRYILVLQIVVSISVVIYYIITAPFAWLMNS